ncbi:anaerobic ribonucleoside-triphosphate reductase activating protein [Aquabacterium sp.]|uniref:anaerobic ribonucleoside-triphosphate reductase activating protein n=1 Tax=Aquabacterium sp. TaxID=1872578 RepID=UPI0035C76FC3
MIPPLDVGGFTPLSTTDWPGQLAAVVFVQGCPWRCHYCHNPSLQPRQPPCGRDTHTWGKVLDTLRQRQGLLDGVVFSGGEPTLDAALVPAMHEVRELGFQVGLHTAGLYPQRLASVLPLVDWVALDIKTEFEDYKAITSVPRSGEPVRESLALVLGSGKAHELRTTWHPELLSEATLLRMARMLQAAGARHWVLQGYRATPLTEAALGPGERMPPDALVARLRLVGPTLSVR